MLAPVSGAHFKTFGQVQVIATYTGHGKVASPQHQCKSLWWRLQSLALYQLSYNVVSLHLRCSVFILPSYSVFLCKSHQNLWSDYSVAHPAFGNDTDTKHLDEYKYSPKY